MWLLNSWLNHMNNICCDQASIKQTIFVSYLDMFLFTLVEQNVFLAATTRTTLSNSYRHHDNNAKDNDISCIKPHLSGDKIAVNNYQLHCIFNITETHWPILQNREPLYNALWSEHKVQTGSWLTYCLFWSRLWTVLRWLMNIWHWQKAETTLEMRQSVLWIQLTTLPVNMSANS